MRVLSSKCLSASERALLQGMLDAPERVEIHGSDRDWRAGVLAAVMATAGMSFGLARADTDTAHLSHIDAPPVSFFAKKAVVPNTDAAARELLHRAGAQEIASTAVSVKPTVYPFAFRAGMDEDQVHDRVVQFVFSGRVMEPALGGPIRLQNNLVADVPKTATPMSWSYVAKEKGRTGCTFLISDQHAPAIASLARATGLSTEAALDFAVMHESAHCAQQAEAVTAAYDVMNSGRVLPERVASGMLGAPAEEAIAGGKEAEVFLSGFLSGRSNKLSAERFADAFAMLALMAQNRINGQQIEGLIAWRLADAPTHNTASFLAFVRDQVRRDHSSFAVMQAPSGPGFDAQAIAAFLRPQWNAFEKAEITARRESSEGLKEVLAAGMKSRLAASAPPVSPSSATHGRSVFSN
ncbi:hypothetical protein [Variovorax sp. RA8]|uniref:hypothetical protein n=1 Tax=Variovorax sp. (strain JCM 16519 / RA8) TaxID=662548 RepID=UPI001315B814|nr:hypothetical protein [Variovorax sp. RA8]VTU44087.1 hypothetical protein RA8P2_00042 [Variovorax sp. RA8]